MRLHRSRSILAKHESQVRTSSLWVSLCGCWLRLSLPVVEEEPRLVDGVDSGGAGEVTVALATGGRWQMSAFGRSDWLAEQSAQMTWPQLRQWCFLNHQLNDEWQIGQAATSASSCQVGVVVAVVVVSAMSALMSTLGERRT